MHDDFYLPSTVFTSSSIIGSVLCRIARDMGILEIGVKKKTVQHYPLVFLSHLLKHADVL